MANEYNVSLGNDEDFSVSLSSAGLSALESGSFTVALQGSGTSGGGGSGEVDKLIQLNDVNVTNLSSGTDKFVLVYDAPSNSFKFINPDEVIDSAIGDNPAPEGLTSTAIDYLDDVLDDKIDLDGGSF